MGLVLSAVISYAGLNEAIACVKHLLSGIVPLEQPGFDDLVLYYTRELRKCEKTANNWMTACGQSYLSLKEDEEGKLSSAAIKYYNGQADSTAILFSTKISSFGDSVEELPVANGGYKKERYSPIKTKTIVLNTPSETFSVSNRNKSPGPDTTETSASSFDDRFGNRRNLEVKGDEDKSDRDEKQDDSDKLTWKYTPLNITPEIQFQPYDDDKPGFFNEDYLRSLDGIKYRPLLRSDPSGRRRSYRRHRSSSSNSSKESRASRDEELQIFTSLEEAEFSKASESEAGFGSAPNLSAHSFRSRSREDRNENSSMEATADTTDEAKVKEAKVDSFDDQTKETEVIDEEDEDDFWGNSGD